MTIKNPQQAGKEKIQYDLPTFSIVNAIKQSSQQMAKKYIQQSLEHTGLRKRIVKDLIDYVKDPDVDDGMKIYILEKLVRMRMTTQELESQMKKRGHKMQQKMEKSGEVASDGTHKMQQKITKNKHDMRRQRITIKTGTIGDYIQQQSIKSLIPELESIENISVQVALLNLLRMMGRKLMKLPEKSRTRLVEILHTMLKIDEDTINKNEDVVKTIDDHKKRLKSILEIFSMLEIMDETVVQSMHRLKNTCRDRGIRAHIRIPEDKSKSRSGFIRRKLRNKSKSLSKEFEELKKEAEHVLDRASGTFSTKRNNRGYVEHTYETAMKEQPYNRMEFAKYLETILKTANPTIKDRKIQQLLRLYDMIYSMK
jgi:hypothetical protein